MVGTRPEVIKMAPLILALKEKIWAEVRVLATAQHRDMLDQTLNFFNIEPDIDLDIMQPNQTLTALTSRVLTGMEDILPVEIPDVVLVQGDTTTVMAVALACFYHKIPIGHIEAGLRTWDLMNPFPEEMNRVMTGKFAQWHFAPTNGSRENLLKEGVADARITVTGNTVIDALRIVTKKNLSLNAGIDSKKRLVLITCHRRENFGEPFKNICNALKVLAKKHPEIQFLYPIHPNPHIKNVAYELLGDISNIILSDPLSYPAFIEAMRSAYLIITDSGGVQEEAPAFGVPVLVLREETERPEAVFEGVVKLIGTKADRIIQEVETVLNNNEAYKEMAHDIFPYGDGFASQRIVKVLKDHFIK